jgi:hypothetical protein
METYDGKSKYPMVKHGKNVGRREETVFGRKKHYKLGDL